jgi:hypothetical protein
MNYMVNSQQRKQKKARQAEVDLIGNNDLLLDDEMTD